jgi:hypothetical protein
MRSEGHGPLPGPLSDEGKEGPSLSARVARAAPAAQVLSETLWEAVHDELKARPRQGSGDGSPMDRVSALAERIADVTTTLALLARTRTQPFLSSTPPAADAAPSTESATASPSPAQADAVLVDERDEPREEPTHDSDVLAADHSASPPAGIGLVEGALERFQHDETPFAVLLLEAIGVEQAQGHLRLGEVPRLMRIAEAGAARVLEAIGPRSAASLALEGHGRVWLCVSETGGVGVDELARRVTAALVDVGAPSAPTDPAERYFAALSRHSSPPLGVNGLQLRLAIGAAICPEDGRDAAALVKRARDELAARRRVRRQTASLADPV